MRPQLLVPLALLLFTSAASAQSPDPRLEALGALSAAQVYTSFRYIDTMAHSLSAGAYKPKEAAAFMDEVAGMTANVATFIKKVARTNITDADKKYFAETTNILELLREQAMAASRRAQADTKETRAVYAKARTASWTRIKALLNLK
jgi:hypothetical protein